MGGHDETTRVSPKPGFQASETTRGEFTVYTQGDDPVFKTRARTLEFRGVSASDAVPSLINVQTSKALGSPVGTFTAVVDAGAFDTDLSEVIFDDDWVDIVITKWGEPHHILRGLVESVEKSLVASASGATTKSWTISGMDYGKIWTKTPVFFNRYIGENVGGGVTLRAFAANDEIFGNPADTVFTFLKSFLDVFLEKGNTSWALPVGMPVPLLGDRDRYFANAFRFFEDYFTNVPERHSINAHMLDYQNNLLWDLAQQWSDPQFCEMYVDLLDASTGSYPVPGEALPIDNSLMGLVFRDRPFPTNAVPGVKVADSPWFKLPLYELRPQDIVSKRVTRSGAERKNAFFAQPKYMAEHAGPQVDLSLPLWDKTDIRKHGIRRMDYTSNYVAKDDTLLGMTDIHREQMRDWFALNSYYFAGTLALGHGRPDIRIGTRVRIKGRSDSEDETYYVEGVSHNWSYAGGARTNLQVTRGWVGDDASHIAAINGLTDRYRLATKAVPDLKDLRFLA